MVTTARNGDVEIAWEDLGGAGGEPLLLLMGLGASRFWWPPALVEALVGARLPRGVDGQPRLRGVDPLHLAARGQPDRPAGLQADPLHGRGHDRRRRRRPRRRRLGRTPTSSATRWAGGWPRPPPLRHPHRVRTLTTSGAVPVDVGTLRRLTLIDLRTLAGLARGRFPRTPEGDVEASVAMQRALSGPDFDEAAARAVAERDRASGLRDTDAQSRQMSATWHGGGLEALRVPTLVLHGERDPLIRPAAAPWSPAASRAARWSCCPARATTSRARTRHGRRAGARARRPGPRRALDGPASRLRSGPLPRRARPPGGGFSGRPGNPFPLPERLVRRTSTSAHTARIPGPEPRSTPCPARRSPGRPPPRSSSPPSSCPLPPRTRRPPPCPTRRRWSTPRSSSPPPHPRSPRRRSSRASAPRRRPHRRPRGPDGHRTDDTDRADR